MKIFKKLFSRYHHLARDFVDETDYPPTQEYILYSYQQVHTILTYKLYLHTNICNYFTYLNKSRCYNSLVLFPASKKTVDCSDAVRSLVNIYSNILVCLPIPLS